MNLRLMLPIAVSIYTVLAIPAVLAAPNILLIIADDMGVETLETYGLGETTPFTPNIDELAQQGVKFTNFWSQPVCSPTRATIVSGRYGFRTGIGRAISKSGPIPGAPGGAVSINAPPTNSALRDIPRHGLMNDEYALPTAISEAGYATAAIGKWHLADADNGWLDHANIVGFDYFSGGWGGSTESFFEWNKITNGENELVQGYAPTDKVNDAISWIEGQADNPWFMWLGFNLPHTPLHTPPSYQESEPVGGYTDQQKYDAMIETMDDEIGRLLQGIAPNVLENTYVIFMGDNGTPNGTLRAPVPEGRGKGTVYRGGVNVPFIVSGPDIPKNSHSEALVNSADLFFTIMELAGITPLDVVPEDIAIDSVSFLYSLLNPSEQSRRQWVYADDFFGSYAGFDEASYAMRNQRYKLLHTSGVDQFYDLQNDPWELRNLLEFGLSDAVQTEYRALKNRVTNLRTQNLPLQDN